MKNIPLNLYAFSVFLLMPALAWAEIQVITLKDGTQIIGELVGVNNGKYTIRSTAMGEIKIDSSNVTSIAIPAAAPQAPVVAAPQINPSAQVGGQMQAMQTQLMNNPDVMTEMQKMMEDPEFMQLISDPAVLQAVTAKDPQALQNSPSGQKLMSNPKMRALIEKLQQQH